MQDNFHMTEEEWARLEALLRDSEKHAHAEFFASQVAKDLLREGTEETPGNVLLRYLRERGDETAVRLFRAMELYNHELVRHDLAVAFHLGKETERVA
ncbi:MAG: hypothetical protein GTN69_06580 [Armatimonadetes bacterium]|nr:hypothetical protein [Armatimonadota bacterium]NIO75537.1 hypothetical protein [Armatimonadota bacterium]NIO95914.1 hypothetical protein [Armatimonadota bacterium]